MSSTSRMLLLSTLAVLAACSAPVAPPDPTPGPPTAAPPTAAAADPVSEPTTTIASPVRYRIVPEESQARFLVDEILAGSPKRVVGTTDAVSGEFFGSMADPAGAEVGEVRVDLSGLRTDNSFRNRALHDAILQTGIEANRYAVFRLTAVEGLPAAAEIGVAYPLRLTGDLTIHGVTRNVTFDAELTAASAERIEGTASLKILYRDFEVFILRLPPQVASVSDEVTLELDFVALAE